MVDVDRRGSVAARETVLRTVDLTKRYGGLTAVDRLNLRILEGTVHCVIGPNGAGKSTLFDLITNVQLATAGETFYCGQRITHLAPHRYAALGITRKFQTPALFGDLTVAENLLLGKLGHRAWIYQVTTRPRADEDADVADMLGRMDLADRAHDRSGDLPHGAQQWLEIGMCLMARPRLLLLDEPTAGMSPKETETTAALLQALTVHLTAVVVEHDLAFVRRIADVVTVMHQGVCVAEGTPDEIARSRIVRDVYLGRQGL